MAQEFLSLAVGPAGSVVVLLLVLFAIWKMATVYFFPILQEYIANQQQNFRDILEAHKDDRKVFTSAIESLMVRQDKIETDLTDIKTDIKQIKERF